MSGREPPIISPALSAQANAARLAAWSSLGSMPVPGDRSRDALTRWAADSLWDALSPTGISWIGFYHIAPDRESMLLGHRRDKPACSPIGLHGVCGRGWRERRTLVVRDVAVLGAGYVACDPRDRSELVVPLFEASGECWGVIDADSHEIAAFDQADAAALGAFVQRAGLSCTPVPPAPPLLA